MFAAVRVRVVRAEHADARDDACLGEVLARQHQGFEPRGACGNRHRQRAPHRPDRALEPQLSQHHHATQSFRRDLLRRREHAERDRQVERRALLADVRWGEVHRNALQGKGVS